MGVIARASGAIKKNVRNIYLDYYETYKDGRKFVKNHPFKASLYGALTLFGVQMVRTNEDGFAYQADIVNSCTRLFALTENSRNPASYKYIENVGGLNYNGQLRHFNVGFATIIYKSNCNPELALYRYNCPYLSPSIKEFVTSNLVDLGLMGHWLMLEIMMRDYDINEKEYEGLPS